MTPIEFRALPTDLRDTLLILHSHKDKAKILLNVGFHEADRCPLSPIAGKVGVDWSLGLSRSARRKLEVAGIGKERFTAFIEWYDAVHISDQEKCADAKRARENFLRNFLRNPVPKMQLAST